MRYMGLLKATADTEAGVLPTAELLAKMGDFIEEATKAGILLAGDGLKPSSTGKRVKLENGKFTITDGPFAETKELISGYSIMDLPTLDEAIHWTKRFLEVLGQGECEVRPFFEPSDFGVDVFPPEEQAREAATRQEMERNAERLGR